MVEGLVIKVDRSSYSDENAGKRGNCKGLVSRSVLISFIQPNYLRRRKMKYIDCANGYGGQGRRIGKPGREDSLQVDC